MESNKLTLEETLVKYDKLTKHMLKRKLALICLTHNSRHNSGSTMAVMDQRLSQGISITGMTSIAEGYQRLGFYLYFACLYDLPLIHPRHWGFPWF